MSILHRFTQGYNAGRTKQTISSIYGVPVLRRPVLCYYNTHSRHHSQQQVAMLRSLRRTHALN